MIEMKDRNAQSSGLEKGEVPEYGSDSYCTKRCCCCVWWQVVIIVLLAAGGVAA